ncbi:4Fe-4S binding protein [Candidatus Acetothermia bacterium]|nr:4Fe-4S binding protein [Candidatus Acetothermia bacterium]MBI3460264.1 4Fe-4S binding protein [Candidatus Acetothermia bacterium]
MERFYQGEFYLVTEPSFCKGCGLCVNSCPTNILYLNGKSRIAVKDIAQCIFCGICEARCPDFAIWVVKSTHPTGKIYDSQIRVHGEVGE